MKWIGMPVRAIIVLFAYVFLAFTTIMSILFYTKFWQKQGGLEVREDINALNDWLLGR